MNSYHQIRIRSAHANYPFDGAIAEAILRWTAAGADFIGRAVGRIREQLAAARRKREAESLLFGMSDRDLRDIGLTREQLRWHYRNGRI
jgi:uncharacterized protein YjiS (DUF1127 family)